MNDEVTTATPNKAGDRRSNQITVTSKPTKKPQNSHGSSAFHTLTKMATVPTSFDVRIESEISCSEIDCPLLVTAVGINNKNNKTMAKTRPTEPKSTSSGSFVVSISLSVEGFKLECLSDQRPSADNTSARTHAITMITNANSRKMRSIIPLRGKSRGYLNFKATSMRSASQLAEADVRNYRLPKRVDSTT